MDLCFKAYAVREVSEDAHEFEPLYWVHPQEVNPDDLKGFMYDIFETAAFEAWEKSIRHDWITVVAYDMNWSAYCSCDYIRTHEKSEDWFYGNEVYAELQKL